MRYPLIYSSERKLLRTVCFISNFLSYAFSRLTKTDSSSDEIFLCSFMHSSVLDILLQFWNCLSVGGHLNLNIWTVCFQHLSFFNFRKDPTNGCIPRVCHYLHFVIYLGRKNLSRSPMIWGPLKFTLKIVEFRSSLNLCFKKPDSMQKESGQSEQPLGRKHQKMTHPVAAPIQLPLSSLVSFGKIWPVANEILQIEIKLIWMGGEDRDPS